MANPTILGLDLGTSTGICYGRTDSKLRIETAKLATPAEVRQWGKLRLTRRCDPRVARLASKLAMFRDRGVDIVAFEDVEFSSYTKASQMWASLRAAVWLEFGRHPDVLLECVPVGTLKKFATGAGNADKNGMERAASRLGLDTTELDDNAIDAWHIWRWAERNLSRWQKETTRHSQ